MIDRPDIMQMASGLAAHATARHEVSARNVANADTPGYTAEDLPAFTDIYRGNAGALAMRATRPGHLHAAQTGRPTGTVAQPGRASPDGNSVSLETEMVKAAEIRAEHETALSVYKSSLDILRASLGRR